MPANEENLLERLKLLEGETRHLRKLIHYQHAEIRALRIYAVAKIADLLGKADRNGEFEHVAKITRELYDKWIEDLEKTDPRLASEVDLRAELPQREQELWYGLEKYFPPKDEPPRG